MEKQVWPERGQVEEKNVMTNNGIFDVSDDQVLNET